MTVKAMNRSNSWKR